MTTTSFHTSAIRFLDSFGSAAHQAVDACRTGGDRIGTAAGAQWDRAFEQSRPHLSAETRRNAGNARTVAARYWRQGLTVTTQGADRAVDAVVGLATIALTRTAR